MVGLVGGASGKSSLGFGGREAEPDGWITVEVELIELDSD